MKNKKNKIFAAFSCALAIGTLFNAYGCKKQEESGNGTQIGANDNVEGGLHDYIKKDTGKFVIENGKSDYKILVPENAAQSIETAASELQYFLAEATGVTLNIIAENAAEENGKYISLGATELSEKSGVTASYETLGEQGFIIETKGNDIFIASAREIGTLWGVYGYLEQTLNYDFFYTDVYTINKTEKLPLHELHIADRPDMDCRIEAYGYQRFNVTTKNRLRFREYQEIIAPVEGGDAYHNSLSYLPVEEYGKNGTVEAHGEWYSASERQLCYTAHGDRNSYEKMTELIAEKMFRSLMSTPYLGYNAINIALTDESNVWCTCDACTENEQKYGAKSSSVVLFCNRVADLLEGKFKGTGDRRADTFLLSFFAYYDVQAAPVKSVKNANGEIEYEYAPEMKLNKHVVPVYAPIRANYTENFETHASNRDHAENLKLWSVISDHLYVWCYGEYQKDYFLMYDSFAAMQSLYRYCYKLGVSWFYPQAHYNNSASPAFVALKGYLQSKLGWNVNADVSALTEKFFNAMYGSESAAMRSVFDEMRLNARYQLEELGYKWDINDGSNLQSAYWRKNLLLKWLDELYAINDRLTANGETEEAKAVRLETLTPLHIVTELFGDSLTAEKQKKYRTDLYNYSLESGMNRLHENSDITSYLDKLLKSIG